MAKIEKRKRDLKWWQEAQELEYEDGRKLEEAYNPERLKPGIDGRNTPKVTDMYASKSSANFDKMGAGSSEASKPKKGDGASKTDVEFKDSGTLGCTIS